MTKEEAIKIAPEAITQTNYVNVDDEPYVVNVRYIREDIVDKRLTDGDNTWHKWPEERPTKSGRYLVQIMYEQIFCAEFDTYEGKLGSEWYAQMDERTWDEPYPDKYILAWRELPKPYKEN